MWSVVHVGSDSNFHLMLAAANLILMFGEAYSLAGELLGREGTANALGQNYTRMCTEAIAREERRQGVQAH